MVKVHVPSGLGVQFPPVAPQKAFYGNGQHRTVGTEKRD